MLPPSSIAPARHRANCRVSRATALGCLAVLGGWSAGSLCAHDPKPERVSVATWNLEWFFDHYQGDNRQELAKQQSAPSQGEWDWKLGQVAEVIAKLRPTILCLQEVENQDVVWRLTQKLRDDHNLPYRYAFIQGFDFYTEQDVAIIYQSGLVEFSRREQTKEMFDSNDYYNINKHLFATFQWGSGDQQQQLTVMTVHLRAMPEQAETRTRQARLIRRWIEEKLQANENVIVAGDINTEEDCGSELAAGEMSVLLGPSSNPALQMVDLHQFLNPDLRVTHISGRQYDRILASKSLIEDASEREDLVFSRIVSRRDLVIRGNGVDDNHRDRFYEIAQDQRDVSDHYPVMAEFVIR